LNTLYPSHILLTPRAVGAIITSISWMKKKCKYREVKLLPSFVQLLAGGFVFTKHFNTTLKVVAEYSSDNTVYWAPRHLRPHFCPFWAREINQRSGYKALQLW
jgi:hypothetical protein